MPYFTGMNKFSLRTSALAAGLLLLAGSLQAAPGDTTWVSAHDARDLVWNEAYDEDAVFPDGSTSYGRVLLYFTLGCASGGCSDWDYTVLVHRMDTVTGQNYELGRCITPYGGYMSTSQKGFNNDWSRTFVYDVTDFAGLLQGPERIRVYYDGWSSGFSATLNFAFIEGTPTRDVLDVQVPYHSGAAEWAYGDPATFDATHLPAVTLPLPAGTEDARLRVTASGHGFDNNVVCAEFCERSYTISVDGSPVAIQSMWRDDCGFNPVFPQAGTWLYDRANWCPGSEAWTYFHPLDVATGSTTINLDMDIESYTWAGAQSPSYILSGILVAYGAFNVQLDAEIADVIKPNRAYAHARLNPSCDRPQVLIRNNGGTALTSATIAYGVEGGALCYQVWSGNLAYGESETITLGNVNFSGVNLADPVFFARVESPNGGTDEASWNDEMRVGFDPVPLYDNRFVIWFRTNGVPSENAWTIRDDLGTIVAENSSFTSPFTIHEDTVDLPSGCYVFELTDSDKDGLEFFANGDGTGTIKFKSISSGFLNSFESNFGTAIVHAFTTGLPLGAANSSESCDAVGLPTPADPAYGCWLSPNPAHNAVRVEAYYPGQSHAQLSVFDLAGREVFNQSLQGADQDAINIPLQGLAKGMYVVRIQAGQEAISRKLLVE